MQTFTKGGVPIKISTIVAEIDVNKKELYKEVNGEKFYRFPITLDVGTLDAVISEYLLKGISNRVLLSGYLRSDNLKEPKEHLYTYFNCTDLKPAGENDNKHEIHVHGRITKCGRLSCRRDGKQLLPIVVRCKTADGHTSIIHAILFDKNARLVYSFDDVREVSIAASGHINLRYGAIEVHIDDAEIFRKEDTNNA